MNDLLDLAFQLESELAPLTTVTSFDCGTSVTRELQYTTAVVDATNVDADSFSASVLTNDAVDESVEGGSTSTSPTSRRGSAKIRVHHSTYESLSEGMEAIQNGEVEDTRWCKRVTKLNKIEFNNNLFPCADYNSSLTTSGNAIAEETIAEDSVEEAEQPVAEKPKRGRPKKLVETAPPAKKQKKDLIKMKKK